MKTNNLTVNLKVMNFVVEIPVKKESKTRLNITDIKYVAKVKNL